MSATYAWIITRDFIADEDEPEGSYSNAKGVAGPRDADPEALAALKRGDGFLFRMLDDDGELYYHGRIVVLDGEAPELYVPRDGYKPGATSFIASVPWDEHEAFAPLWDFGTPNAGATELQYRVTGPEGDLVWATV